MRRFFYFSTVFTYPALCVSIALLIVLSGCSSPTAPQSGSNSASGTISWSRRSAILSELNTSYQRAIQSNPSQASAALLSMIDTIPEFQAWAIQDDGSVMAEFEDSTLYVASNNLPPSSTIEPKPSPSHRTKGSIHRAQALVTTANIWETLGSGYDSTLGTDVNTYLSANGYLAAQNGANNPFSPSALKDLKSFPGITLIHTHGGHFRDYKLYFRKSKDTIHYGPLSTLWTDEVPNGEPDSAYRADLLSTRIIYSSNPKRFVGNQPQFETHYAITDKFVQKYLSFDSTSAVFLACCEGFNFSNTFLQKGAYACIGWDTTVRSAVDGKAMRTIFDQLLGTNLDTQVRFTPPERPFDLESIMQGLVSNGWNVDANNNSYLDLAINPAYGSQSNLPATYSLAPTIESLSFEDTGYNASELMTIHWSGPKVESLDEVSITIGGVPTSRWIGALPDTILKVKLPDSGPGSAGNVIISIDGVKSNPVPLTDWRGTVTINNPQFFSGLPLTFTAQYTLHFRADVHSVRLGAGSNWLALFDNPVLMVRDSKCHWHLSGQYTSNGSTYTYYGDGFNPLTVGRGDSVGPFSYMIPDSQWFGEFHYTGPLSSYLTLISGGGKYSITTLNPDGTQTIDPNNTVYQQSGQAQLKMDSVTYTIKAGTDPSSFESWNDIIPTFAPTSKTPGVAGIGISGNH